MGNGGKLGVVTAEAGAYPAAADPLATVLKSQRGAAFGLCKALNLEWDHVHARGIDLGDGLSAAAGAAAVVAELQCADITVREVGYDAAGQRYTTLAKELLDAPVNPSGRTPVP